MNWVKVLAVLMLSRMVLPPAWWFFGILYVGGFVAAAAGVLAARRGARSRTIVWGTLAVLHGLAWQAHLGVWLTGGATFWLGGGGSTAGYVAGGAVKFLPALFGVGLLAWVARGGGLNVREPDESAAARMGTNPSAFHV